MERPHKCEICEDVSFEDYESLHFHMKVHGELKNKIKGVPKMNQKARLASRKRNLNRPRPFACHLCPQRSFSRAHLDQHMLVHFPVKVRCKVCDRDVARKSFKRHMKMHTKGSGIFPENEEDEKCHPNVMNNPESIKVKDEIVLKEFTVFLNRVHPCTKCDKVLFDKAFLDQHELGHEEANAAPKTGKKRTSQCNICHKMLTTHNMARHMRTHLRAER